MTSRSIPAWSTASCSPAHSCWATCIAPILRTRSCSGSGTCGDPVDSQRPTPIKRHTSKSVPWELAVRLGVDENVSNWRFCMRSRFVTIAGLFAFVLIGPVAPHRLRTTRSRRGRRSTRRRSVRSATRSPARAARRTRWTASGRSCRLTTSVHGSPIRWRWPRRRSRRRSRRCRRSTASWPAAEIDALVAYMQSLK